MKDSFTILSCRDYYIDKSMSLKGILDGRREKFLFTRPRRWGKTTFQQMMREFLSMSVDRDGEEIENKSFGSFESLKVVTEDRVNIEDLLFLLRNYDKKLTVKGTNEISNYFEKRRYPWFVQIKSGLSESEKLRRIERLYVRAREGFSHPEEQLKQLNEQQVTEYVENLRANSPKDKMYFKLLSTFGETCKHYKMYPTIFVEFPEIYQLQLDPASKYNESLETEIKLCIAETFQTYEYQIDFLKAQIKKNNKSKQIRELSEFESYLNETNNPCNSLKFLSQLLFSRYQIPIVMIIDEYDRPMNHAYMIGETRYDQVSGCISQILACLKNEESIYYASLTGINGMSKTNIFTGLNNLSEYGILDLEYSECFGFNDSDVVELIRRYNQKLPQKLLDYEELKQWYNNYLVNGTFIFNPYSVIMCLTGQGIIQPYWTETGSIQMILELFKKIEIGKEEIAAFLQKGEAEFCPLRSISWEDMNQPTSQAFLSFLLHTGYLSLAAGETASHKKISKFVIPNKEIRDQFDSELMKPIFQMILEIKCDSIQRTTIVQSAGTNDFTMNLNSNCLKNIFYSNKQSSYNEAYFESVIFAIFFMESAGTFDVEIQKALNRRRIDSIFYPKESNEDQIVVLHEYKVCHENDNQEEIVLDAIWQCLTRNYLRYVSDGKKIYDGKESNWNTVKLRGIVFYPKKETQNWCASSEEYTLSLKEVNDILKIFSCFENKQNTSREKLLSGKRGTRAQIEKERALFLKENKVKSLSGLIKSVPFRYMQTSSGSKIKSCFSSVKLGFSPLSVVNYPLFDPSKCYPFSAESSWRLQASNNPSFKVLDILYVQLVLIVLFVCLQPAQPKNNLLKGSFLIRSLKLLSKVF